MIGGLGEQRRPGVRHQPLSVRPDLYLHIAPTALHPQGDLLNREPRPSDSRRIPTQPDNTAPRTPGARPGNAGSGLGGPGEAWSRTSETGSRTSETVAKLAVPEVVRGVLAFSLFFARGLNVEGIESGGWACPAPKRRTGPPARWPQRSAGTSSGCSPSTQAEGRPERAP